MAEAEPGQKSEAVENPPVVSENRAEEASGNPVGPEEGGENKENNDYGKNDEEKAENGEEKMMSISDAVAASEMKQASREGNGAIPMHGDDR